MIKAKVLRTLSLTAPYPPLTAASGLVRVGDYLYVVGDDENHLGVFLVDDDKPGKAHSLFPETLPEEKKERKKVKPDLEAITYLSAQRVLIAIPSGSKPNRNRGAMVPVTLEGAIAGGTTILDLEWLFQWLRSKFDPPNIESMALLDDSFYLIHRGNKKGHQNVLAVIPVNDFLLGRTGNLALHPIDAFDQVDGVPFTITDATGLGNQHLLFTSVAEKTDNSYDDGPCLGSGIGIMDLRGKVTYCERFSNARKLEGVFAEKSGAKTRVLLVNDEDDRSRPSELVECYL